MIQIDAMIFENIEQVFHRLKDLLKPTSSRNGKFVDGYSDGKDKEFRAIGRWLYQHGYYIDKFPSAFSDGISLVDLGYTEIRQAIQRETGNYTGAVKWASRREFIDNLQFKNNGENNTIVEIQPDLMAIIRDISNRNAAFMDQSDDEKLATLNNAIEFLLRNPNGKYKFVSEDVFFGFLNSESIRKFRNETQMFRHASAQSLMERSLFSDNKKKFYIGLGTLIVVTLYDNEI